MISLYEITHEKSRHDPLAAFEATHVERIPTAFHDFLDENPLFT